MNYLLDTQVIFWLDQAPERLSQKAIAIIEDTSNHLFFSVASIWEMIIITDLGKLKMDKPVLEFVAIHQQVNALKLLDITLEDLSFLIGLPLIHRDPFDRMLIAQARAHNYALVSADAEIKLYPVVCEW